MIVQRTRGEGEDVVFTIDEIKPTKNLCLANVADDGYESCGEPLRRRKDGSEHCKVHGLMH